MCQISRTVQTHEGCGIRNAPFCCNNSCTEDSEHNIYCGRRNCERSSFIIADAHHRHFVDIPTSHMWHSFIINIPFYLRRFFLLNFKTSFFEYAMHTHHTHKIVFWPCRSIPMCACLVFATSDLAYEQPTMFHCCALHMPATHSTYIYMLMLSIIIQQRNVF